ncbi:MAG: AsnC family transcriptional regulator [Candidatus Marinimicrobia bacterium]|nr:AsnC family transcriptional regulator [Candidatus Neomarinimicrobiota bacterium]|tara:strand:+ start:914 stop:1384 length:471 start_codon:yes stop_codon:yes gene_type:complete
MIDASDKSILKILQKDGRASASYISDQIGLSIPAVSDRIKKMQDIGIIKGYEAIIDTKKIGCDVSAFITIVSESSAHFNDVIENAENSSEVVKCYTTTGSGSHILYVVTKNTSSLETLLRKIQSWPGVIRTITNLVLSSYKDFKNLPMSSDKENIT